MCGRYTLFTDTEAREIREIIEAAQRQAGSAPLKTGEIFPTNLAPILTCSRQRIQAEAAVWGFPGFQGRGVLINARAETAAEKRTFQKPLRTSRCAVPSTGFYEWGPGKRKHCFRLPETEALYMAGLWNDYGEERKFVILTTAANASVAPVHDRMPVILPRDRLEEWLLDPEAAQLLLRAPQPGLDAFPEAL